MKKLSKKRIACITGTRADFGILTPLLHAIEQSDTLALTLYATGMHLMKDRGYTLDEVKYYVPQVQIIQATFPKEDHGMAFFAASFLPKVIDTFSKNRPDLVLLLGDRGEMLCAALACLYLRIPVAHIHGGDKTQTVDDAARHAITKLSHLHFTPTRLAMRTVLQMGEERWRVHLVGALGLDSLLSTPLLSREALCKNLGLSSSEPFALVLQHPVSEEVDMARRQMIETLEAIKKTKIQMVVVYPNADTGSHAMIKVIEQYRKEPTVHIFKSIDHATFISLEKHTDVWVGNSSAGVVESSSFKTPVVNVGLRQHGRPQGTNVVNVEYHAQKIYDAVQKCLYDTNFKRKLHGCKSPWGDGKTTSRIMNVLETIHLDQRVLTKM